MSSISGNYFEILRNLKEKIRNARLQASITANSILLTTYWEIGRTIHQQELIEGWGAKTIETLAIDLRLEFTDMKGLSTRNLRYMRDFAVAYPQFIVLQDPVAKLESAEDEQSAILQRSVAKLPWGHNCTLLDKIKLTEERLFYAQKSFENGWSRDVLALQIERKMYERQGKAITNFERTLPLPQSDLARETLKNPYVFDFLNIGEQIQEKELEKALIQHIKKFMLELGRGFAYVGNQYNLNVEGDDYFLDLLFYNYHLHCFVVFELKVGPFKPEFAGKLNFYINAIDAQIRGVEDRPTIGVLLCKTPNDTVVKFALKNVNTPIGVSDYELTNALPKQFKGEMPTIEELEKELEEKAETLQRPVDKKLDKMKDLLKKLNQEELQKELSQKVILSLFIEVLPEIQQQTEKIIGKQMKLFSEAWIARSINGSASKYATSFDNDSSLLNDNIQQLGLYIKLDGLKQAGLKAFSVTKELCFGLERFKYSIGLSRSVIWQERLYHQDWSKHEIKLLAEQWSEAIVDEINRQLENITLNN